MRKILFGVVAMSLVIGGVAYAEDFIVVRSSDPRIAKSTSFNAGERVYLAKGHTMTVINGAGTLSTYQGATGGIVLPAGVASSNPSRLSGLMALLQRPPQRRTFGAMRGNGDCPKPSELTTVDAIVAADGEGCSDAARIALEGMAASQK